MKTHHSKTRAKINQVAIIMNYIIQRIQRVRQLKYLPYFPRTNGVRVKDLDLRTYLPSLTIEIVR